MEEVSIGEFARGSHLSVKALRLYDELGVLVPARVDEASGYRYYDAAQLEYLFRDAEKLPDETARIEHESAR